MGWKKKVAIGVGGVLGLGLVGIGGFVAYAVVTFESRVMFPDTPRPTLQASADPAVIEQGRYLVNGPAHCSSCHSGTDREHPEQVKTSPLKGGLEFAMGPIATTYSRNLTPDATGIASTSDADIARVLRHGVLPDGSLSIFMRYSAARPADEDVVAILSYLRSLEPRANPVPAGQWFVGGKVMLAMVTVGPNLDPAPKYVPAPAPSAAEPSAEPHAGTEDVLAAVADMRVEPVVSPGAEPTVERGDYLANNLMLCVGCHSIGDMSTFLPVGPKGGGGVAEPSHGKDSDFEFVTPNLTSDPSGITGKLDEDQFVARIHAGRVHASSIMPWENFQQTNEVDLRSVYRYLRSLPPVQNDVGPTYRKIGSHPPKE